jgi:ATP-dependent RNA helicase DeaD
MKQAQRTQVMNSFKKGKSSVLIATDVAARGIDVDGIDIVFNYDIPQDIEYYTHRIGRTGRAGRSGKAYTLVTGRKQVFAIKDISRMVKATIKEIPLPNRKSIIESKCESAINEVASNIKAQNDANVENILSKLLESGLTAEQVALSLLDAKLSKELENVPELDVPQPLKNRRNSDGSSVKTVKIDISVGRNQKVAPNFILGALVEATGMSGKNFGKIDIFDSHTTVEVPKDNHEYVINSLSGGKINGNKVTVRLYEGKKDNRDYKRDGKKSNYGKQGNHRKHSDYYSFDSYNSNNNRKHERGERSNRHNNRRGKSFKG